MIHVHQINLQAAVGGGEIYTRWFAKALAQAGASVTMYVNRRNRFWEGLSNDRIQVVGLRDATDFARLLPARDALVITQSGIPDALVEVVASNHVLTGFAHMPMLGRSSSGFTRYAVVFTVSDYCIDLLRKSGIHQVYPDPMYGTFQLDRAASQNAPIRAGSPYHWDRHKVRDQLLSAVEPVIRNFRSWPVFGRRPGLTLGIVSLIAPIKQFPALFSLLAPHIARTADVNLEIFGNGGYAQVRDLRTALKPIADRVRFWGYQAAVQEIYPELDYLMTGLPEKEALGLNVLEAQALGTPVLAPKAAPFTETILDGVTGFLYQDPRVDGGADFSAVLSRLSGRCVRPDPRRATQHLEKFSFAALVARARIALERLEREFPQIRHV